MRVYKSSWVQATHQECAEYVNEEIANWKGRRICSFVTSGALAVGARAYSLFFHSLWAVKSTLSFGPRLIKVGVACAAMENSIFSFSFVSRITRVYSALIKTVTCQAALAIGGIFIPEVVYGRYELHKSLFTLELKTFIETLPEFPLVQKNVRNIAGVIPLAQIWKRLKLPDSLWKGELLEILKAEYQNDPKKGARLLNPADPEFQKWFYHVVASNVVKELDKRQSEGKLTPDLVSNLNPLYWILLWVHVSVDVRKEILTICPQLEDALQNDEEFREDFERITEASFRSPFVIMACNHLLEKMKASRDLLLAQKIYNADDIVGSIGDALVAIVNLGIMRFVDGAKLVKGSPDLYEITTKSGQTILVRREYKLFGEKRLARLNSVLAKMPASEKLAICKRLCVNAIDEPLLLEIMNDDMKSSLERAGTRLIKSSNPDEIVITIESGADKGQQIRIKNDKQFFGTREQLVSLKEELDSMTAEEKQALFERLCMNDTNIKKALGTLSFAYNNPKVVECFNLVGELREDQIQRRAMTENVRKADQTAWGDAWAMFVHYHIQFSYKDKPCTLSLKQHDVPDPATIMIDDSPYKFSRDAATPDCVVNFFESLSGKSLTIDELQKQLSSLGGISSLNFARKENWA